MLFLEAKISVCAFFYTFSMSAYHGHHHHYLQCQHIYHHLSPYRIFTRLGLVVFSLFSRIKCTIRLYFGHKMCICVFVFEEVGGGETRWPLSSAIVSGPRHHLGMRASLVTFR